MPISWPKRWRGWGAAGWKRKAAAAHHRVELQVAGYFTDTRPRFPAQRTIVGMRYSYEKSRRRRPRGGWWPASESSDEVAHLQLQLLRETAKDALLLKEALYRHAVERILAMFWAYLRVRQCGARPRQPLEAAASIAPRSSTMHGMPRRTTISGSCWRNSGRWRGNQPLRGRPPVGAGFCRRTLQSCQRVAVERKVKTRSLSTAKRSDSSPISAKPTTTLARFSVRKES